MRPAQPSLCAFRARAARRRREGIDPGAEMGHRSATFGRGLAPLKLPSPPGLEMKVRNSLKSLRSRHRANQLVRRKGRVYIINKVQKRFKARQG